jgi:hypothetical protein
MRTQLLAATAIAGAEILLQLVVPGSTHAEPYTIMVENLMPGGPDTGQPLTPPLAVVHDAGYNLFAPGGFATPGLELQAEDGDPSVLAGEAMASASVFDVVIGDGPFFDEVTLSVDGMPGQLLSVSTMLARTNDLITGIHDLVLPTDSAPAEMMTSAYDAGTEVNTGMVEHIPFYGNTLVGPDESEPIQEIMEYTVVNDPTHGQLNYTFPPVARITVQRGATPVEAVTWGAVKSLWSR